MASHQAYEIQPDLEDEEDLVATSGEGLLPLPATTQNKGKGRAGSLSPDPLLAGRIGGGAPGSVGERTTRSTIGGIQTETR